MKPKNFISPERIAIISVKKRISKNKYIEAEEMNECYALQHKYTLIYLDEYHETSYNCKQPDFLFQRHCIVSNFALQYKHLFDYFLFIDNDIGILNPKKKLEKYLPLNEEQIIFYERYFNHEIAIGSFIFKNSHYTRRLLHFIADFIYKMPPIHCGGDNIPLHGAIFDFIATSSYRKEYNICNNIWNNLNIKINIWKNCMMYVACIRWALNKMDEGNNLYDYQSFDNNKIIVLKKFNERRWVRDIWVTNFKFSTDDFFIHGLKSDYMLKEKKLIFDDFIFNRDLCRGPNYFDAWKYNNNSITDTDTINKLLFYWKEKAYKEYIKLLEEGKIYNNYN
uniref:Glycosyltransferase n=1 Tax=Parastrongyloides trichosuri TaxID=131310 RepID=A0A0N4ZLP3_PARTI